jgi:hypothetical protein
MISPMRILGWLMGLEPKLLGNPGARLYLFSEGADNDRAPSFPTNFPRNFPRRTA